MKSKIPGTLAERQQTKNLSEENHTTSDQVLTVQHSMDTGGWLRCYNK